MAFYGAVPLWVRRCKATHKDVERAAKQANAHEFIMALERGYDTLCGELGEHLSGGQRARVAIARALLSRPAFLLMDEATAALDARAEKEVSATIAEITAKREQTVVLVAHRLATVVQCDHIMVLVDGQVAEFGNHQQLMSAQGVYCALVRAQTLLHNTAKK